MKNQGPNYQQMGKSTVSITIRGQFNFLSKFRPVQLAVCVVSYSGTLPHLIQTKENLIIYHIDYLNIYRIRSTINFNDCLTIILFIIVFQMIKIKKTTLPKLSQSLAKRKKSYQANCQNQRPPAFNSKGYFDPSEPYDQQYMQLKERVFEKYRHRQSEYVMLDIKNINRAAFIQKGCLLTTKENNQSLEDSVSMGKSRQILLKQYLTRKQRRENLDSEKYHLDAPKINGDILQSRITANSKSFCRSRVSSNSHFKSEFQC